MDNFAVSIFGWNQPFFVNALSDITPHSLYATVPLVTLVGYLYDNNGNKVNKTITINRWLILDITTPNNP